MIPEVEALLDKARRSVTSARRLLEGGDADFAVSRAYYAMFYAAEAALLSRGLSFSKHARVLAEFNRQFATTGEIPAHHATMLHEAFEQRLIADYSHEAAYPAARARRLLESAQAFVSDVEAYLRRAGSG